MDKRIGMYGSVINFVGVFGFALNMMIGTEFGSYITSMFIAFGFVPMMCAFSANRKENSQTAGYAAMIFGAMYATVILLVYFAQTTAVRLDHLSEDVLKIVDYSQFGLAFSYDLLGYCLMAIATFFAGLTIDVKHRQDKWLKVLLMLHGIFAISCFIMPMLGIFRSDMQGADWIGVAVLEFWCIYFIPISILSFMYFKRK
ncbi:MAG TPA: hypothetical protein VN258_10670 [Mobilitalea sp.]|nr:hypothetical protein [Mobilitalea sp.]